MPVKALTLMWKQIQPLIADMQQAQLLMVAGFVMLGWVLARRQVKMRKRVNRDTRVAKRELKQIRESKMPSVPLADAPPETQRWQVAMFDLQRELKAELDTRITIVQTLLRQVDERIQLLSQLSGTNAAPGTDTLVPSAPVLGAQQRTVEQLRRDGHSAEEIASRTKLPLGDIEMAISMMRAHD